MDRFRVLSDLHMDVNRNFPFSIGDTGVFTVVAGDVSGYPYIFSSPGRSRPVKVEVENERKAYGFFNGSEYVKVVYDRGSGEWRWNGKPVLPESSGISVSTYGETAEGDFFTLSIASPERWLRKNAPNGVLVAGNHLVYNRGGLSLEGLKKELAGKFPPDASMTFLDSSVGTVSKEVDGILFVGSTLYTDYSYSPPSLRRMYGKGGGKDAGKLIVECNARNAVSYMNDFRFGMVEDGGKLRPLSPMDYLRYFRESISSIKEAVESEPDRDVVVVTHHCPSAGCISDKYVSSETNASYVSDLEGFIVSHPNIRCWVCGHVHHRASFKVGGCRVVMNPLGYCRSGEYMGECGNGGAWTPDTFVDTRTWEVETVPFDLSEWDRKVKELLDAERNAPFFMF